MATPPAPVPPVVPGLPLPPPAMPPTAQNYVEAVAFAERTRWLYENGDDAVGPDDVVAAAHYQNDTLRSLQNGDLDLAGAPAWVLAFFQRLSGACDQVDALNNRMARIHAIAARSFNASLPPKAPNTVYEIVPFDNGQDPTLPPHSLPPLHSELDLKNLSVNHLEQYLHGYNIPLVARRSHDMYAVAHAPNRLLLARKLGISP